MTSNQIPRRKTVQKDVTLVLQAVRRSVRACERACRFTCFASFPTYIRANKRLRSLERFELGQRVVIFELGQRIVNEGKLIGMA